MPHKDKDKRSVGRTIQKDNLMSELREAYMDFLGMKSKAEKTEAAILARLSGREGVTVLLPFGGGNGRYDMVIEERGLRDMKCGAGGRNRTDDRRITNALLYL